MAKLRIVFNKKAREDKKRHGRFPTAPPTEFHKDKSKYTRKVKHQKGYSNG